MTEEQAFLAALDLPDATARAAYLNEACGADAEFRRQVEALLAAHFHTGEFLDVPAVKQVKTGSRDENTLAIEGAVVSADKDDEDESDGLPFLTPSTRPDSLGRLGHYEMLQVLGKGGFGIVFRAFDDMLQRVVAVKVMAPQIATLSPARKRFLREARSSAQVRHENVVHIYEVGEQPLPYLVMEFIPGETLQQKLDRTGPLDVPEILRIGRQLAEGLAAAHACDLIHRDIKPGNILLEGGSHKAKITDFGLARAADDASISQSGVIAGTPMFMAPEQALGHRIDRRADLFSLGSVLYQMASGRPPFRAPSALAVLKRVAEEPPRPIPEIIPETPDWLCGIIAKLHAKNPEERFQSAREVADLLADCEAKLKAKQEVNNVLAPSPSAVKPGRRKWVASAAVLLLPVIALAVTEFAGVTHLFRGQQATPDPIKPGGDPTPNQVTKQGLPDAEGWVQLFNGKNLTGWKTHPDQPGDWRVENGILIGRGPRSHLFSERGDYGDFHLRAELKLDPGGNSGVCFRSGFKLVRGGEDPNPQLPPGFEADINDTPNQVARTGTLWRIGPGAWPLVQIKESPAPAGTWVTLEVIAVGGRVTVRVNGRTTADWTETQPGRRTGHVALQVNWPETTVVRFRKIEIKEVAPGKSDAPPPAVAPFDAAKAKAHQDAWARYLGVPVEPTNSIGMKLRLIPPGEFTMGSSKEEIDWLLTQAPSLEDAEEFVKNWVRSEGPARRVTIREPFLLGADEVTVGQFREFVKATGYKTDAEKSGGGFVWNNDVKKWEREPDRVWSSPKYSGGENYPVTFVTSDDVRAFCAWLGKQDGRKYAIPTEEQWEYACRAGTTTRWSFGDDPKAMSKYGWTGPHAAAKYHSVGRLAANPFGLFDMYGNAAELVLTANGEEYQRGGTATESQWRARSAWRVPVHGDLDPIYTRGFRVAVVGDLKPPPSKPEPLPPTFKNSIGMEFAIVPKGKSWLGGGKDKLGDQEVEIPADFYLGKYEVTQEEWEKVMGENPSHFSRAGGGKDAVKDIPDADLQRFPVENVSWDQCQIFVAKLNKLAKETGWVYRLPTAVEWEYACRGGPLADKVDSACDFYFAKPTKTLLKEQANFNKGRQRTCKVGSYEANRLGLFDMHGNVWEWCDDKATPAEGASNRVIRGGCWALDATFCRAALRGTDPPSKRSDYLGLRLARVPPGAPSPEAKITP